MAAPHSAKADDLFGTLLGAGVGGLLGNQFGSGDGKAAMTGAGVLLGGLLGNQISRNSYRQPPRSYPVTSYAVQPIAYRTYTPNYVAPPAPPPIYADDDYGSYCREYSQMIRVGGRIRESYGTACLQPDGNWKIVN
ncbi:MAG: glycine zipper 2TM domain-containing protein [Alphaproteobacteria bacterium]